MKSMTGYGEASEHVGGAKIIVQVRSLNHRHLDLQLRVPREYLAFEEEVRKTIRQMISRGRIDVFINRSAGKEPGRKLELDKTLLGQYLSAFKLAKKKYHLAGEIDVSLLSRVPDLFRLRDIEADPARERRSLLAALGNAMKKLEQSREREGRQLKTDMLAQINHLKRISIGLETCSGEIGIRLQRPSTMKNEGETLSREEKEANELGGSVLKGDINEELVRLKSHVAALGQVSREWEPVGKKIDFMLQEVQRELNTISSKVPQLSVVQLVLEGKERVEKIREQTQNIE
jgi:uncharacterized protein (TIGR00255 family)